MTYFDEIGMITAPDMVFIPKRLVSRTNICDEAKMIFSDVLTENRLHTPDEVKRAIYDVSDEYIKGYSEVYKKHSAARIKRDLRWTADNIAELFAPSEGGKNDI